ncbi:hypothetical protein [Alkalicoccobacillus plakortidis]|uniref:Uncharacterized protein n=1 Tax=Alkalicoccobacillus plakortidis TaxID=444060 RepID=A0ABT0XM00_9BACI|nr:hypothetical protein [Alkalicoccobacillus plakortidis]MCM2676348.1 hypothetical protein [Alkalicoccobacillus plakortidis]
MKKAEAMDHQLHTLDHPITSADIQSIVSSVYQINLDKLPILPTEARGTVFSPGTTSEEAIATHLAQHSGELGGVQIRQIINNIFGVNLDAISALDGARISLFSKGQWVVQQETDLFVVWTGEGDIDVKVYPTSYFAEQSGASALPKELKDSLTAIGYLYDESTGGCYYENPSGDAVPDEFKGRTMGAILQVIKESYSQM